MVVLGRPGWLGVLSGVPHQQRRAAPSPEADGGPGCPARAGRGTVCLRSSSTALRHQPRGSEDRMAGFDVAADGVALKKAGSGRELAAHPNADKSKRCQSHLQWKKTKWIVWRELAA